MKEKRELFFVGCLIKGKAGEFQCNLVKEIAESFGVRNCYERIPPHITFKTPFGASASEIGEAESALKSLSLAVKKALVILDGFGYFRKDTVFINVIPSREVEEIQRAVAKTLKAFPWITFGRFERARTKMHVTVAYKDIGEKFQDIWNFVKKSRPYFEIMLDNVSVFQMDRMLKKWTVVKEFQLK